ncbi:MAG: sigma-54 dependent transcriptional regulator [SAR324 cluster bacterium]|nr:sigma-54 dependent transcriptional regulator [SAR324 cluster bacterium]MCH2296288.1 sigma-54 dependent transcriptional regulator [SAR324 cluster bacterium]MCH2302241.1 sigma-54 dependent transcriptional regulator [SAR324 cluster bacterium]
MISNPILIVDDEVEMRIAMSETLKHCGYPVELSHNAIDALKKYKENDYSMVITDMTMPKRSGLELLKDIKRLDSAKPVIMATAYATVETAVEAMKHGAFDYIKKPIDFDSFLFLVERALAFKGHTGSMVPLEGEPKPVKGRVTETSKEIVTQNQEMLNLLDVTQNISKSKATVLIQSESGTGKELLAHYIHDHSERAGKPFVAVNCAALPDTLLESELFGYKKGAFTGANQDHRGKFEQAHTGTILLDEISEMALPLQAKLLRVLQEHEIDKVGGKEPIQVDVRVVATTNRGMLEMVESGKFREDLYFRLNVIPLALPALRERMDDLPVLVEHFLDKHSRLNKRERPTVSPETMAILRDYRWRGNVRELENVVERALLLCDGKEIKPHNLLMHSQMGKQSINQDLARATTSQPTSESAEEIPESKDSALGIEVGMSMKEAEKKLIFETLRETGGNRTKAAKILGISIRTLRNKLNEYRAEGEDIEVEAEN